MSSGKSIDYVGSNYFNRFRQITALSEMIIQLGRLSNSSNSSYILMACNTAEESGMRWRMEITIVLVVEM